MTITPWFITGLVEGEGCFSISFSLRKKLKLGIETRPSFSISLNRRDLELLKEVNSFFKCGAIRYSRADRTYKFEVRSVLDIAEKIIPHFKKYPLCGSKANDFVLFSDICYKVKLNHHKNKIFLKEIISSAYEMNPSGKRKYDKRDLLRMLDE